MPPHNKANRGDYAPTVLMPGDPNRARAIAQKYFDQPRLVNDVRGALGYTGTYKGTPISVQAGGMGMASTAIYAQELWDLYGVNTIIRVGSCGAIDPLLHVGDVVCASTASTDGAMLTDQKARATEALLQLYADANPGVIVGDIFSSDWFYSPKKDWHKDVDSIAVEMETHVLYRLAQRLGKQALSVCTVSDHITVPQRAYTADERAERTDSMMNTIWNILHRV